MQYTWQLALGALPSCSCLYFIKHSVSCYIYYEKLTVYQVIILHM